MNRAEQLREAIESCFACELPENTEFVIIDNASTDHTQTVVNELFASQPYSYYYEKMVENLGVGGGRNYAFSKSSGEYVYVLDDDAVIDYETQPYFFKNAIQILDDDSSIITLTTQIYDTAWGSDRLTIDQLPKYKDSYYLTKMFCGGSHYLRKSFFDTSPYLPNKYGYEEIPPSLYVIDANKHNLFVPDLRVIHKPLVDKWDRTKKANDEILIKSVVLPYSIKKMMYPSIFIPVLWFAHKMRCCRHFSTDKDVRKRAKQVTQEFLKQYSIDKKIKTKTVFYLVKNFGLSAF